MEINQSLKEKAFPLRRHRNFSFIQDLDFSAVSRVGLEKVGIALTEFKRRIKEEKLYYFEPNSNNQLDMLWANNSIQVCLTGNRFGKTTALSVKLIMLMMGIHPLQALGLFPKPPLACRVVGSDFANGIDKIIIPIMLDFCPEKEIEHSPLRSKDKTLILNNKSFCEFMSEEQDLIKFEGTSRHIIWQDEQGRQDIWKVNRKRVMDKGGQLWMSLTPDKYKGLTWEYTELLLKDGREGVRVYRGSTYDNAKNLPDYSFKEWVKSLSEDEKQCYIYGNFLPLSRLAVNLNNYNIKPPMLARPKGWIRVGGLDVGGAGKDVSQPTAWLLASVDSFKKVVHIEDEYCGRATIEENANKILRKKQGFTVSRSYIDPVSGAIHSKESGKTIIQLYRNAGIVPLVSGVKNVRIGLDAINDALKHDEIIDSPRLIIHSNCVGLIEDLRTINLDSLSDGHFLSCLRWIMAAKPWELMDYRLEGAIYEDTPKEKVYEILHGEVA